MRLRRKRLRLRHLLPLLHLSFADYYEALTTLCFVPDSNTTVLVRRPVFG